MQPVEPLQMGGVCVCFRVRKASRALTRLYDEALAPAGLTVTQFSMLRNTLRMGNPTLNELAEATGHERSALWRTLQPLAREKLLTLAPEKGQRADRVTVTDAGKAAVQTALPLWEASQARVRAKLGEDREKALIKMLKSVEELSAWSPG